MQDLYDPALAERHLAAQRDRGGHHPAHLATPLGDKRAGKAAPQGGGAGGEARNGNGAGPHRSPARPTDNGELGGVQLPFEEL
jgi:hypothetical protein